MRQMVAMEDMGGWEHWANKLNNGSLMEASEMDEYGACITELGHSVIVDVYIRAAIRPLKKNSLRYQ